MAPLTIVALSHLAWERGLFQRPQQLMTQFAAMGADVHYFGVVGYRRFAEMQPAERLHRPAPNLHAANIPQVPLEKRVRPLRRVTDFLTWLRARSPLLKAGEGRRVLWLQHPRFARLAARLPHDLCVYDVMDPHAAFRSADPRVAAEEALAFSKADVVFTGGRSLHALVSERHNNVHCFPSGIDFEHFAKAAAEGPVAEKVSKLKSPVLGYFGAVDERIDWKLVRHLCAERAHWNIVFLGPLIGMTAPPIEAKNFHWLGAVDYAALPEYLRAFDVCLIPWKLDELTRAMSPTKTPEYLASGRPVVTVAIPDVVAEYGRHVLVASSKQEFVEQCTRALMQGKSAPVRPDCVREWRDIAQGMMGLMEAHG